MFAKQNPIDYWAQQSPFSIALKTAERDYTWPQLAAQVRAVASCLYDQGLRAGEVVTLVGKNSPELLWLLLANMRLGALSALTMPSPTPDLAQKLTSLYRESQTPWLWLDESARRQAAQTATLQFGVAPDTQTQNAQTRGSESALAETLFDLQRLATIVFTSGSTGVPKAVAHAHCQHFASAQGLLERFPFVASDTWLLSLPLYHVSGLSIIYRWLTAGACLKLAQGDLAQDIQATTHASLVPTQLQRLLNSQQPLTLTHVLLGGSQIPLSIAEQAQRQGVNTWLGYGMTEAASTVTAKSVDGHAGVGQVLPKRRVELRGDAIFIGGETLACGYFYQGKLTPLGDATGWFATGDLGCWQGDELQIMGRADNLFVSGGENIHCEEIEAVLSGYPQVAQAFVVAVENQEFGARPVAILDVEALPDSGALNAWLASRLVKFKCPDAYFKMPAELKARGIKVSRQKLKQWLTQTSAFRVIR